MPEAKAFAESLIKKYKEDLERKLEWLFKQKGYNEYAVLYYEGKIDAMTSILKDGQKMCELDERFGL